MQPGDDDPFSALAAALERAGHAAAAQRLRDALASGSTGTEALGNAGVVLGDLRRELRCLRDAAFAPLVGACARAARRASVTPQPGALSGGPSATTWRVLGAAFVVLGVVVYWMADDSAPLPARHTLSVHSGTIAEVQRARSAVHLRLSGDGRTFRYLSKGGEIVRVEAALKASVGAMATVRFDAAAPPLTIYELSVPGRVERSYDEVVADWRSDERFGEWLGLGFLALGAVFVVRSLAGRR